MPNVAAWTKRFAYLIVEFVDQVFVLIVERARFIE